MKTSDWGLLLLLSVLWGGSFFFIEVALASLSPFSLVAVRVTLAALVLYLFMKIKQEGVPRNLAAWKSFLVMGCLNNVIPFCLIVWGQTQISGGLASILNATTPFFALVLAHFLTADEKLSVTKVVGLLIGFVGVIVIFGSDLLSEVGSQTFAQFAILAAAFSYGLAGIFGRRFKAMGISPMATATGQLTSSAVIMLPLAFLLEEPLSLMSAEANVIASVIGLAVLSTSLAYVLYFRILATAGATNLLLVTFLIPVSAILLGGLVLQEQLGSHQLLGMCIIFLGLIVIDGRILRRFKSKV